MVRGFLKVLAGLALAVLGGSAATAAPASYALVPLTAILPVVGCESLGHVDLAPVTGAATTQSARKVAGDHPYCEVTGTVAPAIRFEVRLPLAGWTQRFLQTGCGGLCGMLRVEAEKAEGCAPATDGLIVLASTDMGHQGMDPTWGADAHKRIYFAYGSVHITVLAARGLIQAFYGQAPRYSYFSGCSDGGREALIEAQRSPGDFDGIAAGAPALNFTIQNSFHHAWLAKANTGPDGKRLLTAIDMKPLHKAVLKACDGIDRLVDGQISDPRACRYDPAPLLCKRGYIAGTCLTADQIAAVRQIYTGATGPHGEKLEVGPIMRGSEMEWIGVFVPLDRDAPVMSAMFALGTINNLLFTPNPQHPYTIASFPFDAAMFQREETARALYDADDPKLAPFTSHGGKLILWHGWSDPHISPLNTIDYYARVGRTMGQAARDQAVRMFLFPGMGHCSGGDGPSEFPLLAALMSWVETGQAPQALVAHRAGATLEGLPGPKGPAQGPAQGPPQGPAQRPPQGVVPPMMTPARSVLSPRSRPVFAYPAVARYSGKGSPDDAASFVATMPPAQDSDVAAWIGAVKPRPRAAN